MLALHGDAVSRIAPLSKACASTPTMWNTPRKIFPEGFARKSWKTRGAVRAATVWKWLVLRFLTARLW